MNLTEHFKDTELECPCCGELSFDSWFLERIQELRYKIARPLVITSAFRCKEHNDSVDGSPTSQHLIGRAVDISTTNFTSAQLYQLIKAAYDLGFKGVGVSKTFIHLDCRDSKSKLWVY
jgi:uncharacterized protein YcbK (DUF882 family)